jgi:uncharacterized repeat protein (TIGR01451 family)
MKKPTDNGSIGWSFFAGLTLLVLVGGLITRMPLTVHDNGMFEVDVDSGIGDGDTINDANVAGEDWADVFDGTSRAFATSFINDSFGNDPIPGFLGRTPEASFFTGDGSQDTECLQDPCDSPSGGAGGPWLYSTVDNQVPDRNDIVTAFAAAYHEPDAGDIHFYFGLDTYSVQGSANAGFWFFRRPVTLSPPAPGQTVGRFNGDHADGDIFVSIWYEQGGELSSVEVYQWDSTPGPGDKPVGLRSLLSSADADCANAPGSGSVCGVINLTPGEDPPWRYLNANGDASYESAAFVEVGLNLSKLLGRDVGCFSSFLAETRSAPSLTTERKDFTLGAFPVCSIEVIKKAHQPSKIGDEIRFTITIENTGQATLYKRSVVDTLSDDQGNVVKLIDLSGDPGCGASLAGGEKCTINLARASGPDDPDPLLGTVEVLYTEHPGDGLELRDRFTMTTPRPALPLNETARDVDGVTRGMTPQKETLTVKRQGDRFSRQGDTVNYAVTIENRSSMAVQLDRIVDVNDASETRDLKNPTAYDISTCGANPAPDDGKPGGHDECTITFSRATQHNDPDPFGDEVRVTFSNGSVTGTAAATWSVNMIHPSYEVARSCIAATALPLAPDMFVSFRIDTENTGDAELVLTAIEDPALGELLPDELRLGTRPGVDENSPGPFPLTPSCTDADYQHNDPRESGCLRIEKSFQVGDKDPPNAATVSARLDDRFGLPDTFDEPADAACGAEEHGITRTAAFWKTHGSDGERFDFSLGPGLDRGYTCHVAVTRLGCQIRNGAMPCIDLGWTALHDCEDVFGLLWENKTQCGPTETTRIQASQQFLGTILNRAAFGTPIPAECRPRAYKSLSNRALFDLMRNALEHNDRETLETLIPIFACFNEAGDNQAILDQVPVPNADPEGARAVADFDPVPCAT